MRLWVVALLAVAAIVASDTGAPDPLARALLALHSAPAQPEILEAVVAAGLDPEDWRGRDILHEIAVPAPGSDPVEPLRELYAVLSSGTNASAWDDPVRGRVDLVAQLHHNAPAALASPNDAAQSFQLLAVAAAGPGARDAGAGGVTVEQLRERLLSQQHPSGAWGCGPWEGPECTGFALAGLAATGGVPPEAGQAAAMYLQSRFEGGAFHDGLAGTDVQVSAWAIQGLRLAGAEVPQEAVDNVLAQQGADGMWRVAGRPSAWATAEVAVMLAGGHPVAAR